MAMRHGLHFQDGFTLIEVVIAIGIIALLGVVIAQTFFSTVRSNAKVEVMKDVKQNGDFILSVMERMIRNSYRVASSCTDSGSAGSSLSIVNSDGGTTTFLCVPDGTITRVASQSGASVGYLSDEKVTLGGADCSATSLQFICTSDGGIPSGIKISFQLSQKNPFAGVAEQATSEFQSSINLRNHQE